MCRWLLVVAVFLVVPASARADQWVTPQAVTIVSPNKLVEAVLTPSDGGAAKRPTATVRDRGTRGVTYALQTTWAVVDAVVFDDGTLLALDQWHALGYGQVATLYERDGKVRWTKTLAELLGAALVDKAPHSVSSIWWRKRPLEWMLAGDGKSVALTLFDENHLRIALATGAANVEAVTALPDDPRRLFNRAKALVDDGKDADALALLERAMTKDSDFVEAFQVFAGVLQRKGDHQRVVDVLDRASTRWSAAVDGHAIANLRVQWSTSLVALGRHAEAERLLRKAIAAMPVYTHPTRALAELLLQQGRPKEVDVVLDDFAARVMKATNIDTYAIADVGDFYARRNDHAKAIEKYLLVYKKTEVSNQFVYSRLAESYEKVGNLPEATRITEQLLAYFVKMGKPFDSYADEMRKRLARLRGGKP